MTLRDLTPRQLYNLRRKCEKERKEHAKQCGDYVNLVNWNAAYNRGLKAGLSLHPTPP